MPAKSGKASQCNYFAGLLDRNLNLIYTQGISTRLALLRGKAPYYSVIRGTFLVGLSEAPDELQDLFGPFARDYESDYLIVVTDEPARIIRSHMKRVRRAADLHQKYQTSFEYSL